MKLIGLILAWLFIIGLVVVVGRFVLAVIGVGVATVWRFWPLLLVGGVVWLAVDNRRR